MQLWPKNIVKRLNYKSQDKSFDILPNNSADHSNYKEATVLKLHSLPQLLNAFPKQHLIVLSGLVLLLLLSQLSMQDGDQHQLIELSLPVEQTTVPNQPLADADAKEPITEAIEKALDKDFDKNLDIAADEDADDAQTDDAAIVQDETLRWRETEVKAGDSLAAIFSRMGFSPSLLSQIMQSDDKASLFTRIHPGHRFRFATDREDNLQILQYLPAQLVTLEALRLDAGSYSITQQVREPEVQLAFQYAELQDSLSLAAEDAGISQRLVMNMANIFSGVMDFVYDPRKGDRFTLMYEELYLDGKKIANGDILVASYQSQNHKQRFQAFRFEFSDGSAGYFNSEGLSMRKAFLRAPLDFTRISSGFNLRRMHPIHKKIRAHRGTDYAAPRGTPGYAAGDGRIWKSGFSKANGNYIVIRHPGGYETKYLHLDKRFVRSGEKVVQRETIGTVGSTGYSTGPHLHYEFLVNGVHRNPRTIIDKLPTAKPVPKQERAAFEQQLRYLQSQYESLQSAPGEDAGGDDISAVP